MDAHRDGYSRVGANRARRRDAIPSGVTRARIIVIGDAERVRRVVGDGDGVEVVVATSLDALPEGEVPLLVFGDPSAPPASPRVGHVVHPALDDDALGVLARAVAAGGPTPVEAPPHPRPASQIEARQLQRALVASRRLAGASDLAGTEEVATDAVIELCHADQAFLLFYDAGDGALWSEARLGKAGDDRRAIAGLAGFAARTGLPAQADRAASDPRWSEAIDGAAADARVIAQPIRGADGAVHAVIVVVRAARRATFGALEAAMLASFARLAAPFLDHLSEQIHAQAVLDDGAAGGLFRREALDAHALPVRGDVLRISPGWIGAAYWVLVALLVAGLLYVALGRIATYSSGPAIVRSTTRNDVAATTAGNVSHVKIAPGDRVQVGAVIAHLDDSLQRAAVDRLDREFEAQLRNHMLDPGDAVADGALRALRLELQTARAALDDRLLRAPVSGVIADVRVRSGQHVEPGDVIASVADGSGALEVIALLPGSDRPQLASGMAMRLELTGYRYVYQTLAIDAVSAEVIGPSEARRVLGAEVADGLALSGPVVLVRGRLPRGDFEVDGRAFRYHDGMLGTAEVRVRSDRIINVLIPGMRRF